MILAKSNPSRFQWVQHFISVHSTKLTRIHTTRARIAGSSLTRRRPEDLGCDITTILCLGYRLERDYHQRRCLEAILAVTQEAIQGVILRAIPEVIQRVILEVTLEVTPDMGPAQRMEIATRAIRVDHRVDRIQYRDHRGVIFDKKRSTQACALPPTPQSPSQLPRHPRSGNDGPSEENETLKSEGHKPLENTRANGQFPHQRTRNDCT
jgi:hypothetical protein